MCVCVCVYWTLLWYILCKHKLTYEMSMPLNCILYGWFSKPVEKSRASISNWAAVPAITTVFLPTKILLFDSEKRREKKSRKKKLMEQRNCIYIVFYWTMCLCIYWILICCETHSVCVRVRVVRISLAFWQTKRQLVHFIRNEKYGIEWISIKCTPRTH